MDSLPLLAYAEAAARRDAGIKRVSDNSGGWSDRAFATAKSILWLMPDTFTPEDIKHQVLLRIEQPPHFNNWGALMMKLIRAGLVERTGEMSNSTDPLSHRTACPIYRRVDG